MSIETINKKIPSNNGKAEIILANHSSVWADSVPAPIIDANQRDGWYYTNTSATNKANIYFFDGTQENLLLRDINSIWARIAIDSYTHYNVLPFFIVYTKPTGVGDAGTFYHSRLTYTMDANVDIGIGEEVIIHTHFTPNLSYDNRNIVVANLTTSGDGLGSEEVLYITIHTDSGANAGAVKMLFQNLGFSSKQGHTRNLHLKGFQEAQYPTDPTTGILFTTESNRKIEVNESITLINGQYTFSTSVQNIHPSKGDVTIFGNSNTQNTDIEVQYSSDDTTWYFASNHYVNFHGGSNGDFAMDFKTSAKYIRVTQFNNHGSNRQLNINIVVN